MRKRISHSKWTLPFLVLAVALAPAGCAVLTVDVDMYKGPLANEETVIVEQIKAEVIGAKSLLLTLRNTLEEGEEASESYLKKHEFMPMPVDPDERATTWLRNPDAIRVNAILGLYEDSPQVVRDKVAQSYLDQIKSRIDRFRTIQTVMKPNAKGDRLFWEKYAKHLYSTTDQPAIKALQQNITALNKKYEEAKKARDKAEREKDPNEETRHGQMIQKLGDVKGHLEKQQKSLEKGLEQMQLGYRELLYPDHPNNPTIKHRYITKIAQAHNNIRGLDNTVLDPKIEKINLNEIIPDYNARNDTIRKLLNKIKEKEAAPEGTNGIFVWLQNANLVRAHIDLLFKKSLKEQQREEFTRRVNLIARKFIEDRTVVDESFRMALDLIEYVKSKKVEGIEITSLLTKRAAKLALAMIRIKTLRLAIKNKHAPPGTMLLREELLKTDCTLLKEPWNDKMIGPYQEALLKIFEKDPLAISRLLYDTHLSFIDGPYESREGDEENNKYKEKSERKYGIVLAHPDEKEMKEVMASSAELLKLQTGAGLDRGRLPEGLETLIDDYLILARDLRHDSNDEQRNMLEMRRTVLIEALVRLAEKGLVIANYDTLLRGNGDSNKNKKEDKKEKEKEKKKIEQFTSVLQAVGNSIIVMANELRMKASDKRKLEDGRLRENKAMKKVLSSDPNYTHAGITCDPKSSKEVLDGMIALLRYEHIQKIKTSGKDSNEAKWVAEALDVLYKQRANMVYIRPASAYLRSSYPAASLQRDPSVAGWKNMLGMHARRSVPFWGEKAENKNKSDLETLRDIDKQSWQNVNHVRVAGTGDTSYVIVKDDIGNWYIKGYKGDPEPIIKGAKNMALFAASAQTGRNLIGLRKEASKTDGPSPESPRIRQLRQYNTRYQKQLEKDYDKLKKVVDGLPRRIASLWDDSVPDTNGFKDELKKRALKIPQSRLVDVVNEVSAGNDTSFTEKYMDTLSAVVEYHNDIVTALDNPALISEDDGWKSSPKDRKSAVKTARKLMKDTLYDVLNRFIERREIASRDHETALMIVGDTGE